MDIRIVLRSPGRPCLMIKDEDSLIADAVRCFAIPLLPSPALQISFNTIFSCYLKQGKMKLPTRTAVPQKIRLRGLLGAMTLSTGQFK